MKLKHKLSQNTNIYCHNHLTLISSHSNQKLFTYQNAERRMFCGYDIFTHGYWAMDQKNGNALTIKLIFLNVLLKTAATFLLLCLLLRGGIAAFFTSKMSTLLLILV